jgi:hypothetical protein
MTLIKALVILMGLSAPAWAAGRCPRVPTVEPIDAALREVVLSTVDTEKVMRLRASVQHFMARNEASDARAALFEAMALLGYQYRQGLPTVRGTGVCPPAEWQKAP